MPRTTPCLWFDTQAGEAADFYVSVFPNSSVGNVVRYPEDSPFPGPFKPGDVLSLDFTLDGQTYTALNGGPLFTFSEAISFQIYCKDQAEVDHYWDALTADGGEESQCGWLKDKFGLSWQVVPEDFITLSQDPDPKKATAVAQALMSMRKIVIADIRAAYDAA